MFPQGRDPSKLITQKGIFEFAPDTKEMFLANLHPRMTAEDVQKDVPWKLKVSDRLEETQPPSEEEIAFIRNFAPAAAMGRAMTTDIGFTNLTKELEALGKG